MLLYILSNSHFLAAAQLLIYVIGLIGIFFYDSYSGLG